MWVRALVDQFPARFGRGIDTGVAFLRNLRANAGCTKRSRNGSSTGWTDAKAIYA